MRSVCDYRSAISIFGVFVLPVLVVGCSDPIFYFTGEDLPYNLYVVDAEKTYRSAQPNSDELKNAIELLDLKTILNLRGENPGKDWYDQEEALCRLKNVTLISYAMSSRSLPEPEILGGIVDTLQNAEYPLLIHCAGGADRTGAVCAIYKMMIDGEDKDVAREQLSVRYFHFTWNAPAMDQLIDIFEPTDNWLTLYTEEYIKITEGK
jgi:protein tyrosine/serine phosphatase